MPELLSVNGTVASNCAALTSIELPSLETISGASAIASGCNGLERVVLPSLRTIFGGVVASGGTALASIELPAFEFLSGGAVIQGDMRNMSEIHLPAMTQTTNNGILIGDGCATRDNVCHVYLPGLGRATDRTDTPGFCRVIGNPTKALNIHVHLGNQSYESTVYLLAANEAAGSKVKEVTVERGFNTGLRIDLFTGLAKENLTEIIDRLADNSDKPSKQLTLGAANIAKLDEDTIALAQAKNYTIV